MTLLETVNKYLNDKREIEIISEINGGYVLNTADYIINNCLTKKIGDLEVINEYVDDIGNIIILIK